MVMSKPVTFISPKDLLGRVGRIFLTLGWGGVEWMGSRVRGTSPLGLGVGLGGTFSRLWISTCFMLYKKSQLSVTLAHLL